MRTPTSIEYTTAVVYERKVSEKRVEIRKDYGDSRGHSTMGHWKRQGTAQFSADFTVQIDVQAIAKQLIAKAQANRSGKAGALGGLVKVWRRNTLTLSTNINDVPPPDGWYEVKS